MSTMRAVVLSEPGPPENLVVTEIPRPVAGPGEVLIGVKASGLNRSELHLRHGVAGGATFPRVPGIEATGVVAEAPGGEFVVGTQVVTMMGGMGRATDGGYAEYVLVPATQVIPFTSALPWELLGAVPEMLQTAYGSLTVGLDAKAGQTLLVRGGTSSVGMALIVLGTRLDMRVLATTRKSASAKLLTDLGAEVIIDNGEIAAEVRRLVLGGVDAAVELIGTNVLRDTLASTRSQGVVCFTGMLSDVWTIPDFYPMDYLANGVRLTAYGGDANDLPTSVLQEFLDAVASGEATVPIGHVYRIDEIVQAHRDMESGAHPGKLVVLP